VLGPATTLTEALALCQAILPDSALVDINLRDGSSGVALARALVERWEVKSREQQAACMLMTVRERLVGVKSQLSNAFRG
jgi:ActR/RegA family two-component response regulator